MMKAEEEDENEDEDDSQVGRHATCGATNDENGAGGGWLARSVWSAGACSRFRSGWGQKRRQALLLTRSSGVERSLSVFGRLVAPHPGPLPQGEGEPYPARP
jgi:hypothetical protein